MDIRKIRLNPNTIENHLEDLLDLRLRTIRDDMRNGTYPETYLHGPGADICRDIWDAVFRDAAKHALAQTGHGVQPAYTDDTVELLTRDGRGSVEGRQPYRYTDVRLEHGRYRIFKDSYEYGDGAVRLLDPAGCDSFVTGLEEDELAGFLLAFDALVPAIRSRMEEWGGEVAEAAGRAMAAKKADMIAQTTADELLDKHVRSLGIDCGCSVSGGTVGVILYGPLDDEYFEIPFGELSAFLQDRKAFSRVLKRIGMGA